MKFELDYLEKLADLVYKNDLSELTLEDEEKAVCFKREKNRTEQVMPLPALTNITSQVLASQAQKQPETENNQEILHRGTPVTASMAGTFYSAPSPDAAPFVKTGDFVGAGQIICIIEAMKLMNEIEAEVSGKITEICVKNGDNVELGQILMYIE